MKSTFQKSLKEYHSDRWKGVDKQIRKFLKSNDDETLHKMRVEVKKLTAISHLIEHATPAFKSEDVLNQLAKVFKISGKIRDYRNALQFCKKFGIDKSVLLKDASKQQHLLKKLNKRYRKKEKEIRGVRRQAKEALKGIHLLHIRDYLSITHLQLSGLLAKKLKDNAIHEARKKIKDFYYVSKMAMEWGKDIISEASLDNFNQLQDAMGNWHDLDKFGNQLKDGKNATAENLVAVKTYQKKIRAKINHLAVSCAVKKP